uniref:CARD domain-containing protein n=1 Tax=Branchiostoma floridae TaxID=7739 RepID=C3YJJ9_BRAFL|eukprot:XP_002603295.1 hypothetical protein BRAFLDRAFT_71410 [Branchiostoma floridae]
MEEKHKVLLHAKRLEITSDLRFRDIRRRLLDSGILNWENLDEIENQQTREDQAKALLDILPTRGPNAFAVFRDALKHRYPHLAWILNDEGQQGPPEGEDKESVVRPLVATLQQQGLAEKDIFFDDVSIKPGEVIRDRIISTLSSQSLELAVVVVSTAFLNKPYWPRLEFETCLKNNKRIFPIWVDANEDNFKAFSELVGKYSPTLKQMSARRVQRDDVTDELTNIAAEVVQRLSTLRSGTPQPAAIQTLVYLTPSNSPSPSDSGSSNEETRPKDQNMQATGVSDEQWVEDRLKVEKARQLDLLGKLGSIQLDLLKKAEGLLSREETEKQTKEVLSQLLKSGIDILKTKMGCAILHLLPINQSSLDSFWAAYMSGQLSAVLTERLITDEMRRLAGQDLAVRVIMLEEQYRQWSEYFKARDMAQTVQEFQSLTMTPAASWTPPACIPLLSAVKKAGSKSEEPIMSKTPLQKLDITICSPGTINDNQLFQMIHAMKHMVSLTDLDLGYLDHVHDDLVHHISPSTKYCSTSKLTSNPVMMLMSSLPRLACLHDLELFKCSFLSGTEVSVMCDSIKGSWSLVKLNINVLEAEWNDAMGAAIGRLFLRLPNLKDLVISNGHRESGTTLSHAVKHLGELRELQELGIRVNMSDDEAKALAVSLQHSERLENFQLMNCGISDTGCTAIAEAFVNMGALKTLNLCSNQISLFGAKSFAAHVGHLVCLEDLDLSHNKLSDDGVILIAEAFHKMKSVTRLRLSSNDISDKGGTVLMGQIGFLTNVRYIDLHHNKLTDAVAQLVVDTVTGMEGLWHVELRYNCFSDDGVDILKQHRHIRSDDQHPEWYLHRRERRKLFHKGTGGQTSSLSKPSAPYGVESRSKVIKGKHKIHSVDPTGSMQEEAEVAETSQSTKS